MENKIQCYFRFPEPLIKELDKCIVRLGYKTRTELFTAFANALLEKETERQEELIFIIAADLRGNQTNKQHLSEPQIKRKLRDIIGKMLMPVIANKGVEAAYDAGCDDVRSEFFEKYGLLLTDSEIHDGFYTYDMLNKSTLRQYRLEKSHPKEEHTHEPENN